MADVILSTLNTTPPQNMPDDLCGIVVNVAEGDLGDGDTSYLYFGLVNTGYNIFGLRFVILETTLTVEATNDPLSVANVDADWADITDVVTSGAVSSITSTGTLTVGFPIAWSRIRIKRVTTDPTNSLVLALTRGRFR